jgi:hypothetical protein
LVNSVAIRINRRDRKEALSFGTKLWPYICDSKIAKIEKKQLKPQMQLAGMFVDS